jgi:hypothetical protein
MAVPLLIRREAEQAAGRQDERDRKAILWLLAIGGLIEALLFWWLLAQPREDFQAFISTPDTPGYVRVALQLAETATLSAGPRTLGYPLFLALGYALGGRENGPVLIIAIQLMLNIGFAWGCWRLLQRLVPGAGLGLRAAATAFCFWAGLGMALSLMTDFMAALSFGLFLYGLMFWRAPTAIVAATICLAVATLTRPTFTFFPLLLPVVAYLAGRLGRRVPWKQLAALTICSLAATGVSVAYQYSFYRYLGPSPTMLMPIQEILYYGVYHRSGPPSDYAAFESEFRGEIARRAGRAFEMLSPAERDMLARELFRERATGHTIDVVANCARNFVKYMFAPVETVALRLIAAMDGAEMYRRVVRPLLTLLCLPIWVGALIPPIGSPSRCKAYYLLVVVCLLYIVGLSAIGTGSGERIRFPMLAFMMPIAVWNIGHLVRYARIWTGQSPQRAA